MILQPSPFDSRHYGVAIARLVREPEDDAAALTRALARARADRLDVVFLRLEAGDPLCATLSTTPVDTLVTSKLDRARSRPSASMPSGVTIEHHPRLDAPEDLAALRAVTSAFRRSHLYSDARLPAANTRALYEEWATNDATGRAGHIVIARAGHALVGYITVLVGEPSSIDLVAVHPSQQGRGIGAALVAATTAWLAARPGEAIVGTQADNPALGLYERYGYVPMATHVTYHLWLDEPAA